MLVVSIKSTNGLKKCRCNIFKIKRLKIKRINFQKLIGELFFFFNSKVFGPRHERFSFYVHKTNFSEKFCQHDLKLHFEVSIELSKEFHICFLILPEAIFSCYWIKSRKVWNTEISLLVAFLLQRTQDTIK